MQACVRLLLNPFPATAGLLPKVSDQAWAVAADMADGVADVSRWMFNHFLQGRPAGFRDKAFYENAQRAFQLQYLVPADDDRLLQEILAGRLDPNQGDS